MDGSNNTHSMPPSGTTSRCITFIILLLCTVTGGCANSYSIWLLTRKTQMVKKHPCITNLSSVSAIFCLIYIPLQMTNDFLFIFHTHSRSLILFKSAIWECGLWVFCLSLAGVALQRFRIMRLRMGRKPGPGLEIGVCVASWATGLLVGCGDLVEMSRMLDELNSGPMSNQKFLVPTGSVADRLAAIVFAATLAVFCVAYPSIVWSSRFNRRTMPTSSGIPMRNYPIDPDPSKIADHPSPQDSRKSRVSKHNVDINSVTFHLARQMLQIAGFSYPVESQPVTSVEKFNLPLFGEQLPRRRSSLDVSQIYTIRKNSQVSHRGHGRISIPGYVGNEDESVVDGSSVMTFDHKLSYTDDELRALRASTSSRGQYLTMWSTGMSLARPSMDGSAFTINALSTATDATSAYSSTTNSQLYPSDKAKRRASDVFDHACISPNQLAQMSSPVLESRPATVHSLMPPAPDRPLRTSDRSMDGHMRHHCRAVRRKSRSQRFRESYHRRCSTRPPAIDDYVNQVLPEALQNKLPPLRHERLIASGAPLHSGSMSSINMMKFPSQHSLDSSSAATCKTSQTEAPSMAKRQYLNKDLAVSFTPRKVSSNSNFSFNSAQVPQRGADRNSPGGSHHSCEGNIHGATCADDKSEIDFYQFLREMDETSVPPLNSAQGRLSMGSEASRLNSWDRQGRYLPGGSGHQSDSGIGDTICHLIGRNRCRIAAFRAFAHFFHLLLLAPLTTLRGIGISPDYEGAQVLFSIGQCAACICFAFSPLIYIYINKGITLHIHKRQVTSDIDYLSSTAWKGYALMFIT